VRKTFKVYRAIIGFGLSKSLLWTTGGDGDSRTFIVSLHVSKVKERNMLHTIVGPVVITFGFCCKNGK